LIILVTQACFKGEGVLSWKRIIVSREKREARSKRSKITREQKERRVRR
jgi:hypothetical protein